MKESGWVTFMLFFKKVPPLKPEVASCQGFPGFPVALIIVFPELTRGGHFVQLNAEI